MKIHLHEEQFDGWLHAACCRLDLKPPSPRIVGEDIFDELPRAKRCVYCTRINWPKGFGDPIEGVKTDAAACR